MYAQRIRHLKYPFLGLFVMITFWQVLCFFINIPPFILPSPLQILKKATLEYKIIVYHSSITIFEAGIGLLFAMILGYLLAIIFLQNKFIKESIYPYVHLIQTTPTIAIAPLLILWFGTGYISKIIIVISMSTYPIIINSLKGLKSVDQEVIDLCKIYTMSSIQILKSVRIRYSLPFLFQALKISANLAVVGAIVSEFIGSNKGLGFLILTSAYHLETTMLFLAIIASGIIGIMFLTTISIIEQKIIFWK